MRQEGDRQVGAEHRQLLLDLRRVAVAGDAVGGDVLVDGDEVRLVGRGAAGAGGAGLGVDDHVGEQAGVRQRREPEQRRGREAAGVGDDVGDLDPLAVAELRQPVGGVLQQLRRGMVAVPLLVRRQVAQAEVGRQVDHAHAPLAQAGDGRRGRVVRVGDDRGVDVAVAVEVELLHHERDAMARIEVVEPAADVRARGDRAQLEVRVALQQRRGERAGIARRAEDGDPRHGETLPTWRAPPRSRCAARRPPRR